MKTADSPCVYHMCMSCRAHILLWSLKYIKSSKNTTKTLSISSSYSVLKLNNQVSKLDGNDD